MVLAVDFDGTLCSGQYPQIGKPNKKLINRLIERQKKGDTIILWTCREKEKLTEAVLWLKKQGIVFDYCNQNTRENIKRFGIDSRKVYADEYWDDKGVNVIALENGGKRQMPITKNREYRAMSLPLTAGATATKRIDSVHYAEGYATTFGVPYQVYESDGIKFYEVIDRGALMGADMSDVIMQYNHGGKVLARQSNNTLGLEVNESGLFVYADLSKSDEARKLHEEIANQLITKMSWAFMIADNGDRYDSSTHTRTILKIKKVYDVSAVSYPANADTDITARSYFDGEIEAERREALVQRVQRLKLNLLLEGLT